MKIKRFKNFNIVTEASDAQLAAREKFKKMISSKKKSDVSNDIKETTDKTKGKPTKKECDCEKNKKETSDNCCETPTKNVSKTKTKKGNIEKFSNFTP